MQDLTRVDFCDAGGRHDLRRITSTSPQYATPFSFWSPPSDIPIGNICGQG
jgi:hypothetical protein